MKNTKRIKATGLSNRTEFEIHIERIAFAQTELRTVQAQRDHAIQEAQADTAARIAELEAEIETKTVLCEKFAEGHRAELLPDEKKSKSVETAFARYGFRTNTPSLKTLSKVTWEQVVTNLRALGLSKFLRLTYDPDKQKLLGAQTTAPLAAIGVRVVQGEDFFIEPKVDGGTKIKSEAA